MMQLLQQLCCLFDESPFSNIFTLYYVAMKCAKFRGVRVIAVLVGLVPLCHRAFMGPKVFLKGIS